MGGRFGAGLVFLGATAVAVHGVAPNESGSAASLQNAGVQVGASIRLSTLAATASIVTKNHLAGHTAASALTDGYVAGLLAGAAIFTLGALVALLTINTRVTAEEVAGHP